MAECCNYNNKSKTNELFDIGAELGQWQKCHLIFFTKSQTMRDDSEEIKWWVVPTPLEPSPYVVLLKQMDKAIRAAMMLPNWQNSKIKKTIGTFVDKDSLSYFITEFGQRIYTCHHTQTDFLRPIAAFEQDFGIKPGYIRQKINNKTHYFPVCAEWAYVPSDGKIAYHHEAEAIIDTSFENPKLLQVNLI